MRSPQTLPGSVYGSLFVHVPVRAATIAILHVAKDLQLGVERLRCHFLFYIGCFLPTCSVLWFWEGKHPRVELCALSLSNMAQSA